jgi:filamentous hemagglutinin
VQAGGNVNITATGGGRESNIHVRGSEISAGNNVNLSADNDITLEAARNTQSQSSTSRSSNSSVGVSYTFGSQNGFTFDAAFGSSRGRDNGIDTGWTSTSISAGNEVNIASGGNTTLRGATILGHRVNADVGGNLNIQTLQDTSLYQSQSSGSGLSVSICAWLCYGESSASVYAHNLRGEGDYASATEQSGIRAGDGGFNVNVRGNTDLVGGVISSTQTALDNDRNSFSTGSLTMSDVQNHDVFQGSGYSVSLSTSASGNSAGVGSSDINQSSTTRSGITGIAGNTEVRTGVDSTNGLQMTDRDRALRDVNAQVLITSNATGLVIQVGPAMANAVVSLLDSLVTRARPVGSVQSTIGLPTASMTPAERSELVRSEFDSVLADPALTDQQRAQVQYLQQFYEAIEQAYSESYDRAPSQGTEETQNVFLQFALPNLLGSGGIAIGGAGANGAGIGTSGGYDPQTDTYTPGAALPPLNSIRDLNLPLVLQGVLRIYEVIITTAQSARSGGSGSGPTGGNGADTYGTPPNGASPPPEGDGRNPTNDSRLNPDGNMLGRDGTKTYSNTLYQRGGVRIDVENPSPGQRPGQIHLQIGDEKYLYNVNINAFESSEGSSLSVPREINNMLRDPRVQRAINTGLRYLGEQPIRF